MNWENRRIQIPIGIFVLWKINLPTIDFHEAIWFHFMECFSQGLQKGTLLCSELLCGWILFYWITRMIALLNNENDCAIENPLRGAHCAPPKEFGSDWSLGCREMSDLSGYRWYHIGYYISYRNIWFREMASLQLIFMKPFDSILVSFRECFMDCLREE